MKGSTNHRVDRHCPLNVVQLTACRAGDIVPDSEQGFKFPVRQHCRKARFSAVRPTTAGEYLLCKSQELLLRRAAARVRGPFRPLEVLGPAAQRGRVKAMIDKYGLVFIKPVFKGGIGKKGKAGLLGRASDLQTALPRRNASTSRSIRSAMPRPRPTASRSRPACRPSTRCYFSISDSHAFSRADDDAHAHGRHGHRGDPQGSTWRIGPVRSRSPA
jgi:hypothetical protein